MNEDAKQKFLEVQSLFRRMSNEEVCVLIESYYIWRTLTFARSIPEIGKEKASKIAILKSFLVYKNANF